MGECVMPMSKMRFRVGHKVKIKKLSADVATIAPELKEAGEIVGVNPEEDSYTIKFGHTTYVVGADNVMPVDYSFFEILALLDDTNIGGGNVAVRVSDGQYFYKYGEQYYWDVPGLTHTDRAVTVHSRNQKERYYLKPRYAPGDLIDVMLYNNKTQVRVAYHNMHTGDMYVTVKVKETDVC